MLSWLELSWFSMEFKRRLSLPSSFFINGYGKDIAMYVGVVSLYLFAHLGEIVHLS